MSDRPMVPCRDVADLLPGDIGFGPLTGWARAATLGQLILGEGFHVGRLNVGHVFVVTEVVYGFAGEEPAVVAVEAMPSGAREVQINDRWSADYAYVRLPEDYPGQAGDAAAIARAMIGTPYSFASYAALAAWRFGLATPRLEKWIGRRRLASEGPMIPQDPDMFIRTSRSGRVALPCEAICSVLADQAWSLTGKKIMSGVSQQCVTPGALAGRLWRMGQEEPGAIWSLPEVS